MVLYKKGMVALSGDPIHNGHLDLIRTAAAQCERLVVLVANNAAKKYLFTLDEREDMVRRAVLEAGIAKPLITADDGLAVDVYQREGCDAFFRGIRNESDEAYEKALADVNRLILEDVNVVMVKAEDPVLRTVSSSMVKEIGQHHGGLERFVPLFVKQMFEERALQQYLIAVTGCVATGKSKVSAGLVETAKAWGLEATRVDVDELLRSLYDEQSPGAAEMRERLADAFGEDVLRREDSGWGPRHYVNRKVLAAKLFDCQPGDLGELVGTRVRRKLDVAQRITQSHVRRRLRGALRAAKGLVVVEWAQLAEMDMAGWMNNNTIVVDSPQREAMLAERNIPADRLVAMNVVQMPYRYKVSMLQQAVQREGHGTVLSFSNVRYADEAGRAAWQASIDGLLQETLWLFPELQAKTQKK